jgi:hypothetical protein
LAITLLTSGEGASWYVARTLQLIKPANLQRDVALLAVQSHWAVRCLAAIT